MEWKPDRGLQLRMIMLLLAMAGVYALVMGVLFVLIQSVIVSAVVVGTIVVAQYWYGSVLALKLSNASRVEKDEYTDLQDRVARIAEQADLPQPDLAISETKAPNAFAAGRNKDNAVVCLTEGLILRLSTDEIDAVIAHELSHMKNGDMRIMTAATAVSSVFFFIVRWGWLMDGGEDSPVFAAIAASFVGWIASFVLIRLLSRYREYAADRGAAIITGNPLALAEALRKISDTAEELPKDDLRDTSGTRAMNFFDMPSGRLATLLSTHPATEDRIEKLKQMQSEAQQGE